MLNENISISTVTCPTSGLSSLRVIVALVLLLSQACSSPSPNRRISLQVLANTASAAAAEDVPFCEGCGI